MKTEIVERIQELADRGFSLKRTIFETSPRHILHGEDFQKINAVIKAFKKAYGDKFTLNTPLYCEYRDWEFFGYTVLETIQQNTHIRNIFHQNNKLKISELYTCITTAFGDAIDYRIVVSTYLHVGNPKFYNFDQWLLGKDYVKAEGSAEFFDI